METPCERVSVVTAKENKASSFTRLAGIHKAGPLIQTVNGGDPVPSELVKRVAEHFDKLPVLSISGYDLDEDIYETILRATLDGFRDSGFRKIRLLRPRGNELRAEEVASRRALDVIAFPYQGAFGLSPTAWVPDARPLKERGVQKPSPHSEIALSPRLASLLLNLAGLTPGDVVLDPFCGSGTILTEAIVRGYRCLGFDASETRVRDARRNLSWVASGIRGANFNVQAGDARELQEILGSTTVDAVVTEPLLLPALEARPRTDTAAALVKGAGEIYADSLASISEVLAPGGRAVVVVPVVQTMEGREVSITLDGKELGLHLHQPGPIPFKYPVRPSFESTRWIRRAVYVFESRS